MIDYINIEQETIRSRNNESSMAIPTKTEVIYSSRDSCNVGWCKLHNILHVQQKNITCGCIVMASGSIMLAIKRKISGGEFLSDKFSKALCEYLKRKGLNSVRCDNNDIMVDNYKVASGAEGKIGMWNYMGYQISINQDIETIKNVCFKPMIKIPKGLGEYGITTDDIVSFCDNYWDKN